MIALGAGGITATPMMKRQIEKSMQQFMETRVISGGLYTQQIAWASLEQPVRLRRSPASSVCSMCHLSLTCGYTGLLWFTNQRNLGLSQN